MKNIPSTNSIQDRILNIHRAIAHGDDFIIDPSFLREHFSQNSTFFCRSFPQYRTITDWFKHQYEFINGTLPDYCERVLCCSTSPCSSDNDDSTLNGSLIVVIVSRGTGNYKQPSDEMKNITFETSYIYTVDQDGKIANMLILFDKFSVWSQLGWHKELKTSSSSVYSSAWL